MSTPDIHVTIAQTQTQTHTHTHLLLGPGLILATACARNPGPPPTQTDTDTQAGGRADEPRQRCARQESRLNAAHDACCSDQTQPLQLSREQIHHLLGHRASLSERPMVVIGLALLKSSRHCSPHLQTFELEIHRFVLWSSCFEWSKHKEASMSENNMMMLV